MITKQPQPGPCSSKVALACPHCGAGLTINMETVGPAYLTYERPESIECDAYSDVHCAATWEPDGTPRDAPEWVRYPGLYEAPALNPSKEAQP